MTTVEGRPAQPCDDCDDCAQEFPPWHTDNAVWNRVMGGPDARDDPGGYLCPTCFTRRADAVLDVPRWRLVPDLPAPPRTP